MIRVTIFLAIPFLIAFILCQDNMNTYNVYQNNQWRSSMYENSRYRNGENGNEKEKSGEEEEKEEEEEEIDHIGPDPFFSDKWYKYDRSGPFSSLLYTFYKYGQATCVEPVFDLALRVCKTEVATTPFEKYLDICVACLLIRDLDRCVPPCSPNNFTCMFYPMNVDIIGFYNFANNVKQGREGFEIDQRG